MDRLWMLLISCALVLPTLAIAQVHTRRVVPENRVVAPFGYGNVSQVLASSSLSDGRKWCRSLDVKLHCISVSGGNKCNLPVPAGELVSCNLAGTARGDFKGFGTVNCRGHALGPIGPLGPEDWCLVADLQPSRETDTLYAFSDYVRIGINKRFGGAIFELYGTDRKNRIMENGGSGMQLSLWGDDVSYAPVGSAIGFFQKTGSVEVCNPTPYKTIERCEALNGGICQAGLVGSNDVDCLTQLACGNNGATAGSPFNPIQAISKNCSYGSTSVSDNEATVSKVYSPAQNVVAIAKFSPQQFTKSTNEATKGLAWSQSVSLQGPFANVLYGIKYDGLVDWTPDFQELPALFSAHGMRGAYLYYYAGQHPYVDALSDVTRAHADRTDTAVQVYQFPGRQGPFGTGIPSGHGALLTEDWVSLCDTQGSSCITICSWSPDAQDVIYGPGNYAYFGVHGFFPVINGLRKSISIWIAPYRFDDVVDGLTVREWIYKLRPHPPR